jgi:hypothetical protein
MAHTVEIDPADSSRLIFNQEVSLAQAIAYLWAKPPAAPNALRPDPHERAVAGRQRRFIINKNDLSVIFSLQHGLADQYARRVRPIMAKGPATLPNWVPLNVREKILGFKLASGVHRFSGEKPWGDIVVSVAHGNDMHYQVYQEYPETLEYYLGITHGNDHNAQLLLKVYKQFNSDMRYFVQQKGLTPEIARSEIRRMNDEVFKLVIEAAVGMLSAGAGISSMNSVMRSTAPKVLEAAERTGFGHTRGTQGAVTQTVEEVRMGQAEYQAALRQVFPGQYLDTVARMVDEIGQRAAQRVINDPQFVQTVQSGNWKLAGTLFHSAAAQEARAVPASALPRGWILRAEQVIQSGAGGSRADILLQGPAGQIIEFDWKTTGRSGLSSAARDEMRRHAGQITVNLGGTVTRQESRSWVDYVRPLMRGVSWP